MQRRLEFVRQSQPVFSRRRFKAAQRTDRALAGAIGSLDGFDKQMIGVGFAFVCSSGLSKIHWPLHIAYPSIPVNTNCDTFSHYYNDADITPSKSTISAGFA